MVTQTLGGKNSPLNARFGFILEKLPTKVVEPMVSPSEATSRGGDKVLVEAINEDDYFKDGVKIENPEEFVSHDGY